MPKSNMTTQKWKEKGDEEFNKCNWSKALSYYTNAIEIVTEDNTEKALYYDKRSATYFELRDYDKTIEDCNSVMKIYHKILSISMFRRFLALIELERFEEARQDMKMILCYSDNTMSQSLPTQFHEISHKHIKEKVSQMMGLAFNVSVDKEERENAMINMLKLASWRTDACEIFIKEVEEDDEAICSAIRIVDELCQNNINQTEPTMINVVLPWCLEMMNSKSTERVNASQYCLQNILNKYSGMNNEPSTKPDEALCEEHKKEINTILSCLLNSVESKTITGLARDAIIELITRNIHYTALDWAKRLVKFDGLKKLMEVASQLEEYQYESLFDITYSTRTIISMSLAKIWKNMDRNVDKGTFVNTIDKFIKDKLFASDTESKLRGVVAITTLIFGPLEVADRIIFTNPSTGCMRILDMAKTDDVLQQKVVCECLVAAMTNFDEVNALINEGVKILRIFLYQSKDDVIRIQALVGFCEWSKFKTRGYISKLFWGEATDKLVKVCRRLLINPKKEKNIIKWAVKGLSYLTLDGNVKDELIKDQQIIQTVFELAKISDQSVLYSVATTLVNVCNAYERLMIESTFQPTFIPEMEESMKFLKFYFLEEYLSKNDEDFVQKRRCLLVKNGVTGALVSLAKTGNQNCKELTARVFSAICGKEELTKTVVQQGGTKALLSLALDGTDKGKKIASQVLVHLAHTLPPEDAFPGDLMMDVVQPITNLLNSECSVNERCEALTALCNLASVKDSMRLHIFNDSGFENFNNYMNDNHNMVDCAYAKLINNLVLCRKVAIQYVKQRYYQLGYLIGWSVVSNVDERTKKAAVEAVTTLTAASEEACEKLLRWDVWPKFLYLLLNNPDNYLQRKGIEIALNMMNSTKDVAAKLIKTDTIMKQVRELSKNDTIQNEEIKELASLVLEAAAKWNQEIEGNVEGNELSDSIA
ncbi:protein unc-45 homolog B-like [Temnothorax longispinosus]|uniref:protein unc-45 homolog B-like n=1 Tax=Temnothorax longispinosus TaxID=300112 RepID=UPI003A99EFE4